MRSIAKRKFHTDFESELVRKATQNVITKAQRGVAYGIWVRGWYDFGEAVQRKIDGTT